MAIGDLIPWGRNRTPALTRGEPMHPFLELHREMNRLFEDALRGARLPAADASFGFGWPQVDVIDAEKEFRVEAELPGLSEKDVEVTLDGTVLTLKGEKKVERDGGELYSERFHGRFQRSIDLGAEVQADKVSATFRNGVLTVVLPKSEQAHARAKRIEVKSR